MSKWQPAIIVDVHHDLPGFDPEIAASVRGKLVHVRPRGKGGIVKDWCCPDLKSRLFVVNPSDVREFMPWIEDGVSVCICEHELLTD